MAWLLAYDISSPRRWRKVYPLARREGVRLQYSLFYIDRPGRIVGDLSAEIGAVIDTREDDVRFYELPDAAPIILGGQMRWPRGITSPLARPLLLRGDGGG
jgi:CRISPR-associated protein Cas2